MILSIRSLVIYFVLTSLMLVLGYAHLLGFSAMGNVLVAGCMFSLVSVPLTWIITRSSN